ncbi:hypothetical protein JTB14_036930 [Gonioctena quinquepunctata]|nr:hypothetical protein JTB14_036930 [Gonioctena quinquepunctata]
MPEVTSGDPYRLEEGELQERPALMELSNGGTAEELRKIFREHVREQIDQKKQSSKVQETPVLPAVTPFLPPEEQGSTEARPKVEPTDEKKIHTSRNQKPQPELAYGDTFYERQEFGGNNAYRLEARAPQNLVEIGQAERRRLSVFLTEELRHVDRSPAVTHLIEHSIRVKATTPIKQRYRFRNPVMQIIIDEKVQRMMSAEVIEPSDSRWSTPIVILREKNEVFRFCDHFRKVNEVSEKKAYTLPQINAILDLLRDTHYISTLDLKESKPITAFTVPERELFQFKVGLHAAPSTFQRVSDHVIGPEITLAFAHLDDIIILSCTFSDHTHMSTEK